MRRNKTLRSFCCSACQSGSQVLRPCGNVLECRFALLFRVSTMQWRSRNEAEVDIPPLPETNLLRFLLVLQYQFSNKKSVTDVAIYCPSPRTKFLAALLARCVFEKLQQKRVSVSLTMCANADCALLQTFLLRCHQRM